LEGGGAERIGGLDQILPWMRQQLECPEAGIKRGQKAQELVKMHQGALGRTAKALRAIVDQRKQN
jgi:hypothetical protein